MLTVASRSSTRKAPMIFLRPAYMTGTKLMLKLAEDLERLLLRVVKVCIPDLSCLRSLSFSLLF